MGLQGCTAAPKSNYALLRRLRNHPLGRYCPCYRNSGYRMDDFLGHRERTQGVLMISSSPLSGAAWACLQG